MNRFLIRTDVGMCLKRGHRCSIPHLVVNIFLTYKSTFPILPLTKRKFLSILINYQFYRERSVADSDAAIERELLGLKSAMEELSLPTGTLITWDDETIIDNKIVTTQVDRNFITY